MNKKVLFTITAIIMVFAMVMTGCTPVANKPANSTATIAPGATTAPTVEVTADPNATPFEAPTIPPTSQGKLTVGVDDSYPPMEFQDETGNRIGFDIDLANEIGKRLNMQVDFVSTSWGAIFTALEAKKFDCIISSLSITEKRKQSILFTQPYIANAQVIVVPNGNTSITKPEDLAGKRVGVQIGTTAEAAATEFQKTITFASIDPYETVIETFAEMKTGRLDAIIVDEVVARYYVTKDPSSYMLSGVKLAPEPIGIGFRLDETVLRDKVDLTITAMKADGTLGAISTKWFGDDITKNLN